LRVSRKMSRKFKFYSNITRITDTFRKDLCTVTIKFRSFLLRSRYVSATSRKKIKTHLMFNNFFP
jgi:hypothetical protein